MCGLAELRTGDIAFDSNFDKPPEQLKLNLDVLASRGLGHT
jgi:hypothetical protein